MNKPKPEVKTTIRISPEMHERIAQLARQEERSFNAQLIVLVKDALNRARLKKE